MQYFAERYQEDELTIVFFKRHMFLSRSKRIQACLSIGHVEIKLYMKRVN